MLKARLSVCFLLIVSLALPLVSADPINPEDIRIESNGEHFQYGDQMDITIYGENNTTYRFFIEDKGYVLRMFYMPIWCNWSGIGRVSWIVNDTLAPRWHLAYIKLPNVTSNPTIEFKVDYTDEQLLNGFIETSNEMRETDKEELFWIVFWIASILIILILVNVAVLWKKILPVKVRLSDPIYDKTLGHTIRPWREYTKFERVLIFIANTLSRSHTKHKIRRKMVKTPYTRTIETDVHPPEKKKQSLDSKRKYLKKLIVEDRAILFKLTDAKARLTTLRAAPDITRDIQAIHMKEREVLELRTERASVGTKINEAKKTIKTQKSELMNLREEEQKGVFIK